MNSSENWRITTIFAVIAAAFAILAPTSAQAGSEFYLSTELGANFASEVDFHGRSNDRPSVCDEYINPRYASVPGCTSVDRGLNTGWKDKFGSARGVLAGAAVGFRLHINSSNDFLSRWRIEGE